MTDRFERQAQERKEWIVDAVWYLLDIGIYTQDEIYDAWSLAESLHWHGKDEGGEMMFTPKESVDEELSYWGD